MSRSPLVHGLRVARALFTSQYALMLEYRAEIALWALSGVLPLIMLGVWSGSGAGADAGLTPCNWPATSWLLLWCASSRSSG